MNDDLSKAAREAVDAAANTRQLELITAVLQAQQLVTQQQPACQHHAPTTSFRPWQWVGIALAGSVVAISLAVSAVAVAIGCIAVTCCLLVLRSMWREFQNHR